MKYLAISLLSALAAASPVLVVAPASAVEVERAIEIQSAIDARQISSTTRTELESGSAPCPKAILIFARGSTESGNMVSQRMCKH